MLLEYSEGEFTPYTLTQQVMKKYTETEIQQHLNALSGWVYEGGFMVRKFVFKDFSEAFGFMSRVALIQEAMHHHADWSGVYNKVTIRLRTHDADGITAKDIELAEKVALIYD